MAYGLKASSCDPLSYKCYVYFLQNDDKNRANDWIDISLINPSTLTYMYISKW